MKWSAALAVSARERKVNRFVTQTGRRYLFTGGGTGGHVTPNLAMIGEIRRRDPSARILYVGSAGGYEKRVEQHGIAFKGVLTAQHVSPRRPIRFATMLVRVLAGILQSLWIIVRFRPNLVVATGGYVSVPPVLAAAILKRRIFVHEQNARPGAANRLLAGFATRVGITFERTLRELPPPKAIHTGYPVRSRIGTASRDAARLKYGIAPESKCVFVVGGSMGSRSINRGIVEALKTLLRHEKVAIIHSTGLFNSPEYNAFDDTCERLKQMGLAPEIPGRYVCKRFIEDIEDVYALADLVVARSGAGTIMELGAIGKPSILIPKSDAPGQHQLENALAFADAGAAEIFYEEPADEEGRVVTRVYGDQLGRRIVDLLDDEELLLQMGRQAHRMVIPEALGRNADVLESLAGGEPVIYKRIVTAKVGLLLDEAGITHELRFNNNVISAGALADVRLLDRGDGERAFLQEARVGGVAEFWIVPRRGQVSINGKPVAQRTRLSPEDVVSIGPNRFTFRVLDREVEREDRPMAVGKKLFATAFGTMTSRMMGFARVAISGGTLGLGQATDLMTFGLRVSNFFRAVFAEVAVDSAFLPTFVQLFRSGRRDEANRLFSTVMKLTLLGSAVVTVGAILTTPLWIDSIAPGFRAKGMVDDAVKLTRIMFPYLILISAAAVIAAVLKAFNRFALPANASIMFSVGMIAGVSFYDRFGIQALGWGVLAGGVGQILVQLPPLFGPEIRKGHGLRFPRGLDMRTPGIRRVGRVTPNILADTTISKAGEIVDVSIASALSDGMISALDFGRQLFLLPFALVAQTINTVVLKELSEGMAVRDKAWTRRMIVNGINWTIFLLVPMAVAMVILAEPIVRGLLQYGKLTAERAPYVMTALQAYSIGLPGWGLVALSGRFFAARNQMGAGTLTNLVALVINVSLSLALVKTPFGFAGIALSSTVTFSIAAVVRLWLLNRDLREEDAAFRFKDLWPTIFQTSFATCAAAIAAAMSLAAVRHFESFPGGVGTIVNRALQLLTPCFFGGFAFAGTAFLMESEQIEELLARFNRKSHDHEPTRPREVRPVVPQWLSAGELLKWVEKNPQLALTFNLNKRVTQLLSRPRWQERNIGCKLAGLLQLRVTRPKLAQLVTNREAMPFYLRFLGADFREPGFVRRNAVVALGQLGDPDEVTANALVTALNDPYFEVRAGAARVLGNLAPFLSDATRHKALAALIGLTESRCFETALNAVRAIGLLAREPAILPVLKKLHYHPNWQVRDAVVCAYEELHKRGVVLDARALLELVDDVLVTCDSFTPRFKLKEDLLRVRRKFDQVSATMGEPA